MELTAWNVLSVIEGPETGPLEELANLVDALKFAQEQEPGENVPTDLTYRRIAERACEPTAPRNLAAAIITDRVSIHALKLASRKAA